MSASEVKAKMKTLTKGQYSDKVIGQMAATFRALVDIADFDSIPVTQPISTEEDEGPGEGGDADSPLAEPIVGVRAERRLTGLVYNINLHLPESRDPAVYDALFRSLREHLVD